MEKSRFQKKPPKYHARLRKNVKQQHQWIHFLRAGAIDCGPPQGMQSQQHGHYRHQQQTECGPAPCFLLQGKAQHIKNAQRHQHQQQNEKIAQQHEQPQAHPECMPAFLHAQIVKKALDTPENFNKNI